MPQTSSKHDKSMTIVSDVDHGTVDFVTAGREQASF
jgi:hypothetical protein